MPKLKKDEMDVAFFFKAMRKKHGWSQYDLADLLEVDQGYIAQLELGRYKKLPMNLIKKLYRDVLKTEKERAFLMDTLLEEFYSYFKS